MTYIIWTAIPKLTNTTQIMEMEIFTDVIKYFVHAVVHPCTTAVVKWGKRFFIVSVNNNYCAKLIIV
jgi:hypothetical protein